MPESSLAQKAAAFTLSPSSTAELIAEARSRIAARRAARPVTEIAVREPAMEDRLDHAVARHDERRFSGAPLTDFSIFR